MMKHLFSDLTEHKNDEMLPLSAQILINFSIVFRQILNSVSSLHDVTLFRHLQVVIKYFKFKTFGNCRFPINSQ